MKLIIFWGKKKEEISTYIVMEVARLKLILVAKHVRRVGVKGENAWDKIITQIHAE